jgi:hypothetical protein
VPNHFFHKVATAPGDTKARIARFNNPITVVKHVVVSTPEAELEGESRTPTIKYTMLRIREPIFLRRMRKNATRVVLNANPVRH